MESIMSEEKECFICKSRTQLELHHVFFGNKNKKISDAEGCTCWLCHYHHTGSRNAVHENGVVDKWLKAECQTIWMNKTGKGVEEFRKLFGKSYV